jgi:hypothetical protein
LLVDPLPVVPVLVEPVLVDPVMLAVPLFVPPEAVPVGLLLLLPEPGERGEAGELDAGDAGVGEPRPGVDGDPVSVGLAGLDGVAV